MAICPPAKVAGVGNPVTQGPQTAYDKRDHQARALTDWSPANPNLEKCFDQSCCLPRPSLRTTPLLPKPLTQSKSRPAHSATTDCASTLRTGVFAPRRAIVGDDESSYSMASAQNGPGT